jgi:hypothetical protein
MELEFRFDDLVGDLEDAVADVQVRDLGVADSPRAVGRVSVGPFLVSSVHPSVRVAVDLPPVTGTYEPGLVVRVRGRCGDGEAEFFNIEETPLPEHPDVTVQVVLSRIR